MALWNQFSIHIYNATSERFRFNVFNIIYGECPLQEANKVIIFLIFYGKQYIYSCSIQNKLHFPSIKDALCQVWLKLAQWFWRRRFLNILNINLLFLYYLHLEKGRALHLNQLESHSLKDVLCQRTNGPISTNLGIKHPQVKGIYIMGHALFQREIMTK